MVTKKTIAVLIGIVLIAFGIGFLALNYGDNPQVSIEPNEVHGFNKFFSKGTGKNKMFTKSVDEEKIKKSKDIKNINIETSFVDINIIVEDRDDIRVHYNGNIHSNYLPKLNTNTKSDTLYIFTDDKNKKNYNVYNTDLKLDIYIPQGFKSNIKINTVSGDGNFSNLEIEKLNIVSTSGDMKFSNLNLDSLYIKTTSGDLWGDNLKVGEVEFMSTSGDIDINDLITKSLLTETTSGDQEFKKLNAEKSNFKTTSGEIEIYGSIDNTKVNTSSGDIELNYNSFNNITIEATSGDVEITLPINAEFNLESSTVSGDIKSDFPITIMGDLKNVLDCSVGNSNNNIEIVTISGDIYIAK